MFGVAVLCSTEILSLFNYISFVPIASLWTALALVSIITSLILLRKTKNIFLKTTYNRLKQLPLFYKFIVTLLILLVSFLATVAYIAPPNTWDSMTYHMGRVMHWMQNANIKYYPSHIQRQVYFSPFAEFIILHLQILTDGDYFANFVQWFSMAGSCIGVSLIARHLGCNAKGQIGASIICASIPMGVLQSTSTQNDYVAAFGMICFIVCFFQYLRNPTYFNSILCALGLALACLTKVTVYLYAVPFVIWLAVSCLKKERLQKAIQTGILITGVFICMNLGFFIRNFQLTNNVLGSDADAGASLVNQSHQPALILSNIVKSTALHLSIDNEAVRQLFERDIVYLHKIADININEQDTSLGSFQLNAGVTILSEDYAGNPFHLLLFFVSLLLLWINYEDIPNRKHSLYYALALIAGFLIFCYYLKWQPFNSRLQLALFVLMSPFIACTLESTLHKYIFKALLVILLIYPGKWLFTNYKRPVIGEKTIFNTSREEMYFFRREGLLEKYKTAATTIKNSNCKVIGVVMGLDDWEYPLSIFTNKPDLLFKHINVTNITAKLPPASDITPCMVVYIDNATNTVRVTKKN
jgi:hypothetical protein